MALYWRCLREQRKCWKIICCFRHCPPRFCQDQILFPPATTLEMRVPEASSEGCRKFERWQSGDWGWDIWSREVWFLPFWWKTGKGHQGKKEWKQPPPRRWMPMEGPSLCRVRAWGGDHCRHGWCGTWCNVQQRRGWTKAWRSTAEWWRFRSVGNGRLSPRTR